ncbi:MAG: ribosome biogenesis GTP-binding protein YihA/YsxC [Chitinophagaceae bacterium]|jgi:GTP-binding protein
MIIKKASYVISSPTVEKCPPPTKPEYAFIGRSNVGKSSLINMIVGQSKLAKTSATPGKTQLINHFLVESSPPVGDSWFLVDLPGYGYAKRSQKEREAWEKMIEDYLRKRENLLAVFILIDSRHEPQKNDLAFVNQLGKWQIPFVIVFTKSDKEKPGVVKRNEKLFLDKMRETWQFLPQSFVTSSEKKLGREELLAYISRQNKEVKD